MQEHHLTIDPPSCQQVHLAFQTIIVIFSIVAIRHVDAMMILISSQSLIPSLVICLSKTSIMLYEDDREIMKLDSVTQYVFVFHPLHQ